jgi:nucleoside-diphosphate-sugar epimerase
VPAAKFQLDATASVGRILTESFKLRDMMQEAKRRPGVPWETAPDGRSEAMTRLLVTGASGYVGQRLCAVAAKHGWDIVVLGTAPAGRGIVRQLDWRLGDDTPSAIFDGVAAVVHLAHSWTSDDEHRVSSANINLTGTEKLAREAFAAGVPRFVFASTTSARPQALNAYGQIKFAIEERLFSLRMMGGQLSCARIGLVYGGTESGQYGLLSRLVRLSPILPMVALDRKVQPIYLDEVVAGVLALTARPAFSSSDRSVAISVLAGTDPIVFGDFLQILRRSHTGKGLILLPIPLWMALLVCDLTKLVPFVPTVDRERVLGLAGTSPMESARDLAALGVEIIPPTRRLAASSAVRRQTIAEARGMLAYVSGRRPLPKAAIARLVRAFDRDGMRPLWISRFVLNCPWLLRLFEPLGVRMDHRLAMRLHLAVMIAESIHSDGRHRTSLLSLLGLSVLEIATLPLRLLFGRIYA